MVSAARGRAADDRADVRPEAVPSEVDALGATTRPGALHRSWGPGGAPELHGSKEKFRERDPRTRDAPRARRESQRPEPPYVFRTGGHPCRGSGLAARMASRRACSSLTGAGWVRMCGLFYLIPSTTMWPTRFAVMYSQGVAATSGYVSCLSNLPSMIGLPPPDCSTYSDHGFTLRVSDCSSCGRRRSLNATWVRIGPGWRMLTPIPCDFSSSRAQLDRPSTAYFEIV